MLYFLFSTACCNLSCSYCGGSPEDLDMPPNPTYQLETLIQFLEKDNDPVIIFYGGEPLVNMKYVMYVMDKIPGATYILQTNGTLLHKLPTEYLLRFECLLISADGRKETIDKYRGEGVFDRLTANVIDAKRRGFKGSVVARMACSLDTDIYEDVKYNATCGLYDHVYWQLDACWDAPMNARWEDFPGWADGPYADGIKRLVNEFIESCERGVVPGIVPFTHVVRPILNKRAGKKDEWLGRLRCSAGWEAISVTTDGKLLACPVAPTELWNRLGRLEGTQDDNEFGHLKVCKCGVDAVTPPASLVSPCDTCDIRDECGGRCLYANRTQWWGDEGYGHVCGTVRTLVNELTRIAPRLENLLASGTIDMSSFEYPAERYSLEIIP